VKESVVVDDKGKLLLCEKLQKYRFSLKEYRDEMQAEEIE